MHLNFPVLFAPSVSLDGFVRAMRPWRVLSVLALLAFPLRAQVTPVGGVIGGRVVNLSVRSKLAPGETLIAGFTLAGSKSVPVLMRAAGPTLATFGVTDAMPDPMFRLVYGNITIGSVYLTQWSMVSIGPEVGPTLDALFNRVGAFPFPAGSGDAALSSTLGAGSYTVVVNSRSSAGSGTVLAEVYDARDSSDPANVRLTNLSVRGRASTDSPLIAGFVVTGGGMRLLFRAAGPALAKFGVAETLVDPRLEIVNSNGDVIQVNNDWSDAINLGSSVDLYEAMKAVGAFPFAFGSKDAAVLMFLSPGAYTVRASGANGASGQTLLEVYETP